MGKAAEYAQNFSSERARGSGKGRGEHSSTNVPMTQNSLLQMASFILITFSHDFNIFRIYLFLT